MATFRQNDDRVYMMRLYWIFSNQTRKDVYRVVTLLFWLKMNFPLFRKGEMCSFSLKITEGSVYIVK